MPQARLPELPADMMEAFDSFKLAIIRESLDGWQHVRADDVLQFLWVLQQIVISKSKGGPTDDR
jgi:hypothetical protein